MTLHVVALDAELYKSKYQSLPNSELHSSEAAQAQVADLLLHSCIEECQITEFKAEIVIPDSSLFDNWAEAIPDYSIVKECMTFFHQLQTPKLDPNNWWMEKAAVKLSVSSPEALFAYSENMHACKFYEILLANIVTGEKANQFIELGEFLELSSRNACFVFSWVS